MEANGLGDTDTALHNREEKKRQEISGRLCLVSFIVTVLASLQPNILTPISSERIKMGNPKYI